MTLSNEERKLLTILQNYPRALQTLATRVRALEMALYDLERNLYHRYRKHVAGIESQKLYLSAFEEESELDQLLELLREMTNETPKRKKKS